jgi:maleate isomerase
VIRIGVLTPHATPGPEVEFAAMAPKRLVIRVAYVTSSATGDDPTSPTALRTLATPAHLDRAATTLRTDATDVIGYASTTSAYVIGFDAEAAMISRLAQLSGLPVAASCASAVHALRVLGVERVALIGAPWFDPGFNELGAAYFTGQGFQVVSSGSAELSQQPREITPAAVLEWTSHHVDDAAQAVFIGGNGFRAAAAIDALETAIGRPVLTSNQVLLWRLLALTDATFTINGYGQLFAHQP